jgi:septal ring factor EnvC (AmiA/AmiB activator)
VSHAKQIDWVWGAASGIEDRLGGVLERNRAHMETLNRMLAAQAGNLEEFRRQTSDATSEARDVANELSELREQVNNLRDDLDSLIDGATRLEQLASANSVNDRALAELTESRGRIVLVMRERPGAEWSPIEVLEKLPASVSLAAVQMAMGRMASESSAQLIRTRHGKYRLAAAFRPR